MTTDADVCIELRRGYVGRSKGREHHWVICCKRAGKPWEIWAGSETKEDVVRIRDGLLERRPELLSWDWALFGPGGG